MNVTIEVTLQSGRALLIAATVIDEDLVAGSTGAHARDRLAVRINGTVHWVERRDVRAPDGELIEWTRWTR